jgi:hypothetical protein
VDQRLVERELRDTVERIVSGHSFADEKKSNLLESRYVLHIPGVVEHTVGPIEGTNQYYGQIDRHTTTLLWKFGN